MKKLATALLFLLVFYGIVQTAAHAAAQTTERPSVAITHKLGTITVPIKPKRVVVMDFGTLDTLDALGVDVQYAVPKANLPAYLAGFKDDGVVNIGGLKEFNLETINAFKPELIIISGRQQDYYKELSPIAPVLFVDNLAKNYLASVEGTLTAIASIFDEKTKVDAAYSEIKAAIARVKTKAATGGKNTLVLLTNDGKVSAYGSGSRFGIIHDVLGLPQADAKIKVGTHGQLVNYEYIAMVNPDIIFVVDRSAAVGNKADGVRILDNALVGKTNAAKNGRIVALDPDVWYLSGGGLQSLAKMVGEIEAVLDK